MVTRSNVDYGKHCREVYEFAMQKFGDAKAKKFINHYKSRYDIYNRSFIDYKLAMTLMNDYRFVHRVGTRWFAIVGTGGTGKTTLMKNILYYLDNQFDNSFLAFDIDKMVEIISKLPVVDARRAIGIDEPDDQYHISSKKGKILRKIFGKIRQQKLWLCFCATDLKDIPPYIFRKLDGIFFTPSLGKFMFFKDRPKKKDYAIQFIRNKYSERGYEIFFDMAKKKRCLSGTTIRDSPFDLNQKDKYLVDKQADFKNDISNFISMKDVTTVGGPPKRNIDYVVKRLFERGMKKIEIAELCGLTKARISQMTKKVGVEA
jgi:hypothetical protein